MKTLIILIIALYTVSTVQAQDIDISSKSAKVRIGDVDISIQRAPFMQGDWELSMTGTIGKSTRSVSSPSPYGSWGNESSTTYGTLSLTAGYYIIDQLSIEPEINFLAYEGEPPGESVLLNLSYTYPIPHSIVAPFIRGGYGLGNATSFLGIPDLAIHSTDNFDIKTLNAGAGVKLIVAQNVALRIEINYRNQTYTLEDISYSLDYKYSTVELFIGFSVLL
jgi:opacity protein-like surface antigen